LAAARSHAASGLRLQSGIPTQDERRYQAAEEHHSQAAAIYRACLDLHPTNAIETRFALGQAYRFAGRLDEAIETFAAVRDAATDHPLVTAAAEQIVFCMERRLAEEQRSTEHYWQDGVVEPLTAFPQHLAALIDARDQYARRTDAENESRARFLLDNARLLLRTGREAEARSRLTDLLERHCAGPPASPRAREALAMLTELALARGDDAQVGRLARSTEARQCTLDPTRRWRPAGAFTTAMIDTRLRSLAERAWESERDGRNGEAMRAYLQLAASSDDAETSATALVRATAVAESERATLVAALRDWLARRSSPRSATGSRVIGTRRTPRKCGSKRSATSPTSCTTSVARPKGVPCGPSSRGSAAAIHSRRAGRSRTSSRRRNSRRCVT
jgi:tetratricopeptide (TPR) repeat protein